MKRMSSLIPWGPTRWDPFKELEEISDRFDRIFGRLPAHRPSGGREALTVADWVPTVDISEDDKEYLIKAEVPEVDKRQMKVGVQEGAVTIQGGRTREKAATARNCPRVEASPESFV